jgi:hypothetical protein
MRYLKFMNRVALICNISYLLMFILQDIKGLEKYNSVVSILIILALVAFVFNSFTLLISTIAFLIKKKNIVPMYLFLLNSMFFLLQFYYFFIAKN